MYALARARTTRTVIALPSGRFLLGAITAADAAEQIFPQARVAKSPGHNAATRSVILSSAGTGQIMQSTGMPAYVPGGPDCQGVSLLKPALMKAASGLALKFVPGAFAAGPIVGGIVLAVAGITKLFGVIFGHHAKAVGKERSILCAAVPSANQSLELIDEAVQQGYATPAQAVAALDSVLSGFRDAVAGIIHGADPMSSGECNAACVMLSALRAIVLLKQSQYQDLEAQQSASLSLPGQVARAISGGNLSGVLPWAAAALGLWLVLKEA